MFLHANIIERKKTTITKKKQHNIPAHKKVSVLFVINIVSIYILIQC